MPAFSQLKNKLNSHPIYNLQFILLCMSSLLFSASFNMLIPELPAYISSLGGAEYKGLIIALFTLTAGISRPFSGKLTDKIGRAHYGHRIHCLFYLWYAISGANNRCRILISAFSARLFNRL